jgi:nucleotide-binding universal stress UspA family protein
MRVLIAIDGGPVSGEVLAGAAAVLRGDDEVHIVSVIDPNEIHETISARGPVHVEGRAIDSQLGATASVVRHLPAEDVIQAAERVDTEHLRAIEGLAKHFLPSATSWTAHVQSGEHPAGVILDIADEIAAEMLVVGTRARRDIVQALLGSVAEQVIRGTMLPVVVIHTSTQES